MHDQLRKRGVERALGVRQILRDARRTSTPGSRAWAAATNASEGSTADTPDTPSRCTGTSVNAPGPQPTSITRCPRLRPTKSANSCPKGSEKRPVKRPYAAAGQ